MPARQNTVYIQPEVLKQAVLVRRRTINQVVMARKIKVSVGALRKWERGTVGMPLSCFLAYIDVLGYELWIAPKYAHPAGAQ
jgi:hypothetical protein